LSVSEGTIRNWRRRGVLKVVRLGPRLLRVPLDEIRRVYRLRNA
jgi:predicted site-specific integrase-resolvase